MDPTDIEVALFFMRHIDEPCGTELVDGSYVNIREFYIQIAKQILPTLTNPYAKTLLEQKIEEYQ